MSEVDFISLVDSGIEILDGDRGKNYPAKSDLEKQGDCVFLNTGNVKINGFDFSDVDFISFEKDSSLRNGKLLRDDVVMTTRGTVGNIAYYSKDILFNHIRINSGMVIIRVNQENWIPYFIYLFLQSDLFKKQTQKLISGSAQPQLPISLLETIRIPKYSKKQQEFIVNQIQVIDHKIALNNQINEELEAMAKTLYDYWFVQFDFPDENGNPYKSSGGKMVYNDQLKREIPEGWGVKRLGDLSTYVTDKISSDVLNSKNYIGTDNMLSNMKGIEQATYLPNSTLVNSYIPNDILIANIRPYFKKIWISDRTGGCSSDVLCLRANDKEICNYLFYSLARDDFFNYNVAGSKGSKMPRGDKAHIQKYSVLFSEKHALKFSKLVSNFISQKHLIYKQNQELSQLRDWLLPMLMNGQVTVE
ncbi:TPA: restriction endonuclease subunit S [Streptococcus suis]